MTTRGLLLDTHVLAWWLRDDPRLSVRARDVIADAEDVYVSAATAYEMANKHRLGKWPDIEDLLERFEAVIEAERFRLLALRSDHCIMAGFFRSPHRDPFDRLIAAQTQADGLTLVTRDPAFETFGLRTFWSSVIPPLAVALGGGGRGGP